MDSKHPLAYRTVSALTTLGTGDLVAALLPPGPAWLEVVREAWEREVALLPVDTRLTEAERRALLERARPTALLDPDGVRPLDGEPCEAALVVATSGAAGEPKLVELSRAAVEHALAASAARLDARPGEPWLACLPPAHIGGLLVYLRAAVLGAPLEVLERFDPMPVARSGAAFTSLVPTMVRRLAAAGLDLRAYRAVLVGGAGLPPAPEGWPLVETYGQTETCGGVVYEGVPLGGVEVRVTEGEIEVAGPTLMHGYRLGPRHEGWLPTGDAGALEGGRLRVLGRLDDAIVTGGEQVWPDEVEAALADHPALEDVAVLGVPDPDLGARVVAVVVAPRPPTLDALRAHLDGRLARFKHPREVVALERIPRTASGKIRRSALRNIAGPMV